ncbi:MAG: hypothetical protein GC157_06405 [Frankiales bacterium]|nr:hypothetical protein [Frankiales bacterium]
MIARRASRALLPLAAVALALPLLAAPPVAAAAPVLRTSALPAAPTTAVRAAVVRPAAIRAGTYAIGDSVMLGSKSLLTSHGITVNASVSRQFHAAVATVALLRRSGKLPRNLVVHLGTNGYVNLSDCTTIVNTAGPSRRVFLVTAKAPRSWIPLANKHLRACAAAYGGHRVVLVDWVRISSRHPEWFYSDRVHPNSTGRPHYVAMITTALRVWGL